MVHVLFLYCFEITILVLVLGPVLLVLQKGHFYTSEHKECLATKKHTLRGVEYHIQNKPTQL